VNVTLPRALRAAYEEAAASHALPTLSGLLERAIADALEHLGWPVPAALDIDESRRRTIDGVAVVSADDVADALRSSWESGTSICEAA